MAGSRHNGIHRASSTPLLLPLFVGHTGFLLSSTCPLARTTFTRAYHGDIRILVRVHVERDLIARLQRVLGPANAGQHRGIGALAVPVQHFTVLILGVEENLHVRIAEFKAGNGGFQDTTLSASYAALP